MFFLFVRGRQPQQDQRRNSASPRRAAAPEPALPRLPTEPEEQVKLVDQTVRQLEQVQRMVRELPELPVGDRQALLDRLSSTMDGLQELYFLDAVF